MMQTLALAKLKRKAEAIRKAREAAVEERKDLTEREQLELDIQRRDDRVKELERYQSQKEKILRGMHADLNNLKQRQMENSYMHSLELGRLNREHEAITKRVETFKRDMEDVSAVQDYADLVREMAPKSVDSNYVMKLQTQLSKAMKKMEAMTQQMVVIQESCDEVVESLLADIKEIVEERCKTELELMNQHADLKEKTREMEDDYETKIGETEKRIAEMREVIAKLDKKDEEGENGDDGDDGGADGDEKKNDSGDNNDDGSANESKKENDEGKEEKEGESENEDKLKELKRLKEKLHDVSDQKAQSIHNLRLESRVKKEKILKMQRINERQEEKIEQLISELNALNNDIEGGMGNSSHGDDAEMYHNGPEVVDGELLE